QVRADRHPDLRAGHPGVAHRAVHEDRLARARSALRVAGRLGETREAAMMQKIRKGDEVIVIAGRDKGKRGTVTRRVDERRLLVDGINSVRKHTKPNPMKGVTGGIVDK